MNRELLKEEIVKAENGDKESIAVVRKVLEPKSGDSVDEILEKMTVFMRLVFLESMRYKDAPFHREIDRAYAEQAHSLVSFGRPKYKGIAIVGYRESAKTTRVGMCEAYMSCYLPQFNDLISVVSEDGEKAKQFNMDAFNVLAFSRIDRYFPETISFENKKKKESQTMSKFTTTAGVTYSSSSARKTKRGSVQADVDESDMSVEIKRPKKVIFDDIENEVTIGSYAATQHIGKVMDATIDGLDQVLGWWVLLGNYLSLRGNVARFMQKHRDSEDVLIISIPILDGVGNPTWPDKYCATDKEQRELYDRGIVKVSIETKRRESDNFEVEYMNNPSRSSVYFDSREISSLVDKESSMVPDYERREGYLELDEPEIDSVYVISADSAKGIGKDQSSFVVWRTDGLRYREVANFKDSKIRPERFAAVIANTAKRYNGATVIPEDNYPGNETIAFLLPLYRNVYVREERDGAPIYGVNTNLKTKADMFLHAKRLLRHGLVEVQSKSLYSQILEYPEADVRTVRDGTGGHFDLLMAAVIGLWKADDVAKIGEKEDNIDKAIASIADRIFDGGTIIR